MRRKNTQMTTNILIVSLLLIGVVYALLQSNLEINGLAKILNNTWDVHFDNIQVSEDSVPIGTGDSPATIDENNNCKVDFEVTLSLPGDFYEFTVDVVNAGTIDGMIGTLNKTLTINNEIVQEVPDYLNYSITYDDGVEIEENHKVSAGTVETYKVRLEFKTDIEELPQAATIVTSLEPQYVQADSSAVEVFHTNRLYNVFAAEYNSGNELVREYTGAHKDSFTKDGSQKIYYWYGSNDTKGTAITNKNNVIFANHCWQMLRTTDTGGVKLIYNGEVENGQCFDTRGNHIGYNSRTVQTLNSDYWYGTDYTYDSTNQMFSIAGTTEQTTWNDSTYAGLVGKYTCISSDEEGTCATLYLVESYKNSTNANVIPINSNSNYSQFGTLQFNADTSTPTYLGYMYGEEYTRSSKNDTNSQSFTEEQITYSSSYFQSTYKYSKTIINNGSGYELVDPILGSNIPESSYAGYYTFRSNTTTSGTAPYYIVGLYYGTYNYFFVSLSPTNDLSTFYIKIADSITDKLDGTYELSGNITSVSPTDWYQNYSNYKNKYTCGDATTTICANPRYITSTYNNTYYYIDVSEKIMIAKNRNGAMLIDTLLVQKIELIKNNNNYKDYKFTCDTDNSTCTEETIRMIYSYDSSGYTYKPNNYFGSSVTWDGTNYTLVDSIGIENYNYSTMNTHHYMCVSPGLKTCSTVAYIYFYISSYYYIVLRDGVVNVSEAMENMFAKNTKSSLIKNGIEAWYKKYLYNDYDQYLEDTIFCNDRSITDLAGWNDSGADISDFLTFKANNLTTSDLSCANITDQFSVSNDKAPLTYKIGLMTSPEMNILNNGNIRKTGQNYWLSSPNYYTHLSAIISKVNANGGLATNEVYYANGVRPAVSLIPGIKFSGGDGSKDNPYIIE